VTTVALTSFNHVAQQISYFIIPRNSLSAMSPNYVSPGYTPSDNDEMPLRIVLNSWHSVGHTNKLNLLTQL